MSKGKVPKEKLIVINKKWRLDERIGGGAFGDIYRGIRLSDDEQVAVKLEPSDTKYPQLETEFKNYRALRGLVGIPNVYYFGVEGDYNLMVMDMCGMFLLHMMYTIHVDESILRVIRLFMHG